MQKFKLSDWVQVIKDYTKDIEVYAFKGGCFSYKQATCKLWKPTKGEWCWFWSENQKIPNLRQFDNQTKTTYWTKDLNLKSDFFGYTNCEPFIGGLPATLVIKD